MHVVDPAASHRLRKAVPLDADVEGLRIVHIEADSDQTCYATAPAPGWPPGMDEFGT